MHPENKPKYLSSLSEKLYAAKKRLSALEHARNTSESAMTSRYDTQRETFAQEVSVQQEFVDKIYLLNDFIENSTPHSLVEEGAELSLEFLDGGDPIEKAFYCPIMLTLGDIQIITPKSPIGAAIKGLKSGDKFSYKVGRELIKGIIKTVE